MSDASTPAGPSRQSMIDTIQHAITHRYSHLEAQFIPDFCMQVKLRLPNARQSLLKTSPQAVIHLLSEEGIVPEHSSQQETTAPGNNQLSLKPEHSSHHGHPFVLKAAIGPNFISFWFRNQSSTHNLDQPVLAALDIIDRIYERLPTLQQTQPTPAEDTATEHADGKQSQSA